MERFCLDCNSKIAGRIDKKFCDDTCRSSYNNKLENEKLSYVRDINRILKRNRKIIEELNPSGKTTVSLEKMQQEGFNFNYFTNIYKTTKGGEYVFCYEYGYLLLPSNAVLLVKRKQEL